MTEAQAHRELEDTDLVQVAHASMQEIKRLRNQCLDANLPAVMMRPPSHGKS